jgi:O-antigen ligase
VVAAAAGVALRVGGDGLWNRYASLANPAGEPSFAFRLDTAKRTLQMAADFPLAGVGLGAFVVAYPMYVPGGRVNRTGAAHNVYAELLAETGALGGVLAAAGLLILLFRYLLPALLRTGSPRRHVVHGLAVGGLAMLLHSAVDFNLQIYSNGLLFVVLVALLAADRLARLPGDGARAGAEVAPTPG